MATSKPTHILCCQQLAFLQSLEASVFGKLLFMLVEKNAFRRFALSEIYSTNIQNIRNLNTMKEASN
jgi:hypothetical protein